MVSWLVLQDAPSQSEEMQFDYVRSYFICGNVLEVECQNNINKNFVNLSRLPLPLHNFKKFLKGHEAWRLRESLKRDNTLND